MFLANRVIPQHKEFLEDHGYEYREIPENEFTRKILECTGAATPVELEVKESPGVLPLSYQQLLYEIEMQPMTMCYKMLLLLEMIDNADSEGRVGLDFLAMRFREFFLDRSKRGKMLENPNRFIKGHLSDRSLEKWRSVIREQPVKHLGAKFLIDEGSSIRWSPDILGQWTPELRGDLKNAATGRLINYFQKYVPGGF